MKIWLIRFSAMFTFLSGILLVWLTVNPPEPQNCSICAYTKSHAPCIVDLSSGEIGELALYEPHYIKVGEISELQQGETFSFINVAGLQGIKITNPWEIRISVPVVGNTIKRTNFCLVCRELLRPHNRGYVLVDLYDPAAPIIMSICDKVEYNLRCYSIYKSQDAEESNCKIIVTGYLRTENKSHKKSSGSIDPLDPLSYEVHLEMA